jgi:tRNA(His) 5'-end guanylyltransferase
MFPFVGRQDACRILKVSLSTLKRYRLEGIWIEGTHWIRVNRRCVRYNIELIQDWFKNRHDPIAHEKMIEAYHFDLSQKPKNARRGLKA